VADELTTNFSLSYSKGSSRLNIPSLQQLIDVASQVRASATQTIGTTHEALVMTDVSSAGAAYFLNTDATNYVDIGVDVTGTFYGLIRLMPGKFAFVPRLATNSPFARANTAAVNLEYIIFSQ
jgi:hypothetical protein